VAVRKLSRSASAEDPYEVFRPYVEARSAETTANLILCLIHQANYLLNQQLRRLEQDFLREGGLRERMTRARLRARKRDEEAT
jgi:four helix bundle suffix protein